MKKNGLFLIFMLITSVILGGGCDDKTSEIIDSTLSIDPATAISYEAEGGATTITVTTNLGAWTATSNQDWCKVVADKSSFTVTAQANSQTTPMPEATVTVTAGAGAAKKTVTLQVNQKAKEAFTIALTNITAMGVTMKVTPTDAAMTYYYDVISSQMLDSEHNNDLSVLVTKTIAAATETHGSIEAAVEAITETGESEYIYTKFAPEREYVAFAVGINIKGEIGDIVKTTFKTLAITANVTFEVTFDGIAFDGTNYAITPSDNTFRYYAAVRPVFKYKDMTDEEIADLIMMEDSFMLDFMAKTGPSTYENEGVWNTDTGYMVLIFGYSGYVRTSQLFKFPFRTSKPTVPPAQCTFDVTVSSLTSRSVNVEILPSDKTNMYMYDLIPDAYYQANKTSMKEYVKEYVTENIDQLDYLLERGDTGNSYSNALEPGTTYYVWAVCINEFGEPSAEVIMSQPFTTLPNVVSDAVVTASIRKYFNGDELFALDPVKYESSKGMAYVEVDFVANDKSKLWYGTMVKEDPADPTSALSDTEISNSLIAGAGTWCPTGKLYLCTWDVENTLLAVGVAKDDNPGPLFRQTNIFTKAGAAPISEFVEPSSGQVAAVSKTAAKAPARSSVKVYRTPETKK